MTRGWRRSRASIRDRRARLRGAGAERLLPRGQGATAPPTSTSWPRRRTGRSRSPATAWARGSASGSRRRTPTGSPRWPASTADAWSRTTPTAHRSAGALRAEVYFGHADQDPSNSPEQIASLDAALEDAGVTHRTEVYPGAAHGYTMSDTPAWDEQAAERHFAALFELLDRTVAR